MLARILLLVLFGVVALGRAQLPHVSLSVDLPPGQLHHIFSEGSTITLVCNSTIAGPIAWRFNGQPVQPGRQYGITGTDNMLLWLYDFDASIEGNYTCLIETRDGTFSSQTVEVQLPYLHTSFLGSSQFEPHQYSIIEGQPIALGCGNISSQPAETVAWEIRVAPNVFDTMLRRSETVDDNGLLVLRHPNAENNLTIYRCIVRNSFLQARTYGWIQVVIKPNRWPAPLQLFSRPLDTVARLGSTVYFRCIPVGLGSSVINVEWSYPASAAVVKRGETLIVTSVTPENAGTYRCNAGSLTSSGNLTIMEPPQLTSYPSSPISVTYGNHLELSCDSISNSAMMWEWYFNGSRMDLSSSTYINSHATLENAGTYQCFSVNLAGLDQSSMIVQVNVIPPTIDPLPSRVIGFSGEPFFLPCNASGAPPPQRNWIKDVDDGVPFNVTGDGLLEINDADISHSGQYNCVATAVLSDHSIHSTTSYSTILQIIEPTFFTAQTEEVLEAQVGTRVVFFCSVNHSSVANISLQWFEDDRPLSPDNRVQVEDEGHGLRLVIDPVMYGDAGQYHCVARTQVGEYEAPEVRSRTTSFRVMSTPVVPSIHEVVSTSPNSIEVQWSYSGDLSQLAVYLIQVQDVQEPTSNYRLLFESPVNAVTRALVSDPSLKAYTEYNVRVTARFLDGSLQHSNSRVVRTKIAKPLDPPRDLGAMPLDKNTIELQWKAPSMPQGPIESYVVLFRGSGSNDSFAVERVGNVTQHRLKNLKTFSGYEVRVAAETEAGVGPFTTSINASFLLITASNTAPFIKSIGFIVLVVAVTLTALVVLIIGILLWRRRVLKKDSRKYFVRNSIHFGKGTTVGMEGTDSHLSAQAVASYFSRHKRAFSSNSPTTPRSQTMPHTSMGLENESSFCGTEHTVSTQVMSTSGCGTVPKFQRPPDYIDPPDPFAAERHRRSRSQSTYSGKSNGDDQDYIVMHSASTSTSPSVWKRDQTSFNYGEDSDNSVEKATLNSSSNDCSEHDTASEYTHNSQLTGQYDMLPPHAIPNNYMIPSNNGWGLPYGRSRSDGKVRTGSASGRMPNGAEFRRGAVSAAGMAPPMTVGQMVEERLRAQSPSEGIMTHATYV